jgi:hypothetical protein
LVWKRVGDSDDLLPRQRTGHSLAASHGAGSSEGRHPISAEVILVARWLLTAVLATIWFPTLQAQSEQVLKSYFEGRKVAVRIDLPATNAGVEVNVLPGGGSTMDFNSYSKRLKSYGVALRDGDSVLVTKVKVKKDMIEFQLGGGGYGTFGDDTDTSVHFIPAEKSEREKDLEKAFDRETDPKQKRLIKEELDSLRRRREREDDRNRRAAEDAAAAKAELIQEKRLQGGSRFNLHFGSNIVPGDLTPERIMQALEQYVDFSEPSASGESAGPPSPEQDQEVTLPAGGSVSIRKGMTRDDVEAIMGTPVSMTESTEGSLKLLTCVYRHDGERIEAVYLDGILIRYTVSSE